MSWLSSDCHGRKRCEHCRRDGNCCLDRRDKGQKGNIAGKQQCWWRGWYCSTAGGKGKARKSPGPSLTLGAAMQGRDRQLLGYITRDSVTSSSICKADSSQQSNTMWTAATFTCSRVHQSILSTPHVPVELVSCSLSAHGGHVCYYARLKNNIQARWMTAFFW